MNDATCPLGAQKGFWYQVQPKNAHCCFSLAQSACGAKTPEGKLEFVIPLILRYFKK